MVIFIRDRPACRSVLTSGSFINLISFAASLGHHADDLLISLLHAHAGEAAEAGDGVLHTLDHQPVAAVELLAVYVHLITENARFHRHGDFGGTGGFRAVTDDATGDGERVDNGVRDGALSAAVKPRDACSRSRAGAHRAAIGGEPADPAFGVQRHQIRDCQRAQQLLLALAQLLCVLRHRQGCRDALIAAAVPARYPRGRRSRRNHRYPPP